MNRNVVSDCQRVSSLWLTSPCIKMSTFRSCQQKQRSRCKLKIQPCQSKTFWYKWQLGCIATWGGPSRQSFSALITRTAPQTLIVLTHQTAAISGHAWLRRKSTAAFIKAFRHTCPYCHLYCQIPLLSNSKLLLKVYFTFKFQYLQIPRQLINSQITVLTNSITCKFIQPDATHFNGQFVGRRL